MDHSTTPLICLDEFQGLGLIIKFHSGVRYTNQTAGYACMHPEVEGVFYPLPTNPGDRSLFFLTQHFCGSWSHLEEKDADVVDRILQRNGHGYLSVDRACLKDSFEAWVHLEIGAPCEQLTGFHGEKAILMWPNSD